MAKPSILLCTPAYTGTTNTYNAARKKTERWCREQGIAFEDITVGNAPIDYEREMLGEAFLSAKTPEGEHFTHCLMIDAGIGWEPDLIGRMLLAEKDFVCAAAPIRQVMLDNVVKAALAGDEKAARLAAYFRVRFTEDGGPLTQMPEIEKGPHGGLVKIVHTGAAVMMLTRRVFERIFEANPQLLHKEGFAYFLPRIENGERLGEDTSFYKFWRDLGEDVWMMLDATIAHEGNFVLTGNVANLFFKP
jgi:hypothetical protein